MTALLLHFCPTFGGTFSTVNTPNASTGFNFVQYYLKLSENIQKHLMQSLTQFDGPLDSVLNRAQANTRGNFGTSRETILQWC